MAKYNFAGGISIGGSGTTNLRCKSCGNTREFPMVSIGTDGKVSAMCRCGSRNVVRTDR
jgi:hypothetical protein